LAHSVHPQTPVVRRALAESIVAIRKAEHGSECDDSDVYSKLSQVKEVTQH
jgi:hypothetical protein